MPMTGESTENPGDDAKAVTQEGLGGRRAISPAALRALKEAAERRDAAAQAETPREIGGRGGLDPARHGDWEVKGIASDF